MGEKKKKLKKQCKFRFGMFEWECVGKEQGSGTVACVASLALNKPSQCKNHILASTATIANRTHLLHPNH